MHFDRLMRTTVKLRVNKLFENKLDYFSSCAENNHYSNFTFNLPATCKTDKRKTRRCSTFSNVKQSNRLLSYTAQNELENDASKATKTSIVKRAFVVKQAESVKQIRHNPGIRL